MFCKGKELLCCRIFLVFPSCVFVLFSGLIINKAFQYLCIFKDIRSVSVEEF